MGQGARPLAPVRVSNFELNLIVKSAQHRNRRCLSDWFPVWIGRPVCDIIDDMIATRTSFMSCGAQIRNLLLLALRFTARSVLVKWFTLAWHLLGPGAQLGAAGSICLRPTLLVIIRPTLFFEKSLNLLVRWSDYPFNIFMHVTIFSTSTKEMKQIEDYMLIIIMSTPFTSCRLQIAPCTSALVIQFVYGENTHVTNVSLSMEYPM